MTTGIRIDQLPPASALAVDDVIYAVDGAGTEDKSVTFELLRESIAPTLVEIVGSASVDLNQYTTDIVVYSTDGSSLYTFTGALPVGKTLTAATSGSRTNIDPTPIEGFTSPIIVESSRSISFVSDGTYLQPRSIDPLLYYDPNQSALGIGLNSLSTVAGTFRSTAFGSSCLASTGLGAENNTGFGYAALNKTDAGARNTAHGSEALFDNGAGNDNVAVGYFALRNNESGSSNVAVGNEALSTNVTGDLNTAVGLNALKVTTDQRNTSIGSNSSLALTTGSRNVAVGNNAMIGSTTAIESTALGASCLTSGNYSGASAVGYGSQVTADDQVQLGGFGTTTFAYGAVQDRSDERDKADIRDTELGLDFIMTLRPVDFKWNYRESYTELVDVIETFVEEETIINDNGEEEVVEVEWEEVVGVEKIYHENDGSKKRSRYHHGVIAQEVRDSGYEFGGFQDHSINGGEDVLSIGYGEFIAPMMKAIQEQQSIIEALTARIDALEAK